MSIIVTSYNHAEYLERRMDSLLAQTYDNLEIIVIDDCSTDGSFEVLKEYSKYQHIKIITLTENGGYAKACNLGVQLSKGNYIMFAECDDYDEPDHIAILMMDLKNNESVGVAYCKSNMVDRNGKMFGDDFQCREKYFKIKCSKDTLITKGEMQKYLLNSCVIPNMSAAIIRKEYFMIIGGLDSKYKACADWDFWCRISNHCDFYYVSTPLNNFRNHDSTVRNTTAINVSVLEIFDLLYKASAHVNLSIHEKLHFKIAIGSVWINYIRNNPIGWITSFPYIFLQSIKYDTFILIYMSIALLKIIFIRIVRLFYRKITVIS